MTKVATFSNGFEDVYKGNRDIKAAWAIIRESDGEVLKSGHSIDRTRAAKTAAATLTSLAYSVGVDLPYFDIPQRLYAGYDYRWLFGYAEDNGYEGKRVYGHYKRWAKAKNEERMAAIEAAVTIEIVDVA